MELTNHNQTKLIPAPPNKHHNDDCDQRRSRGRDQTGVMREFGLKEKGLNGVEKWSHRTTIQKATSRQDNLDCEGKGWWWVC